MTHDEYLSRLELWTDDDAAAVLAHAGGCTACRRDFRSAERALSSDSSARRSRLEEVIRIAAAAAVLAAVVLGMPRTAGTPAPRRGAARYRIVGDSSGTACYTPEGMIVTATGSPAAKETSR